MPRRNIKLRSDREWRFWGEVDPLFGVASWQGKELGGPTPWTPEEFLALGRRDFADILKHWSQYGRADGRCVEIGCGSGRMTRQLVECFSAVHALDVSPEQIASARRLLGSSAAHVTFHVVDRPEIPVGDRSCSAVFTCHVFQHFSSYAAIVRYLEESYRVLESGGSLCAHIPTPGAHRTVREASLPMAMRNLKIRLLRVLGRKRIMEYHRYTARKIFATLEGIGFVRPELRIFPMSSNQDSHSFFFATRP